MGSKIVSWSDNWVEAGQRLILERPTSCIYKDWVSPKGCPRAMILMIFLKISAVTKDCYDQVNKAKRMIQVGLNCEIVITSALAEPFSAPSACICYFTIDSPLATNFPTMRFEVYLVLLSKVFVRCFSCFDSPTMNRAVCDVRRYWTHRRVTSRWCWE